MPVSPSVLPIPEDCYASGIPELAFGATGRKS
jgi:hypothetical protein